MCARPGSASSIEIAKGGNLVVVGADHVAPADHAEDLVVVATLDDGELVDFELGKFA